MEVKYIFGVIGADREECLDCCGFTLGERVHAIPYRDISAVVSTSSLVEYTRLPKDRVARYLLTHQQVIEKVMDHYTIIPMRLGTYAFDTAEVKEILSRGYKKFKDILQKIGNKIEIDLVATWNDLNSMVKEIGELQEIKDLKERMMSRPEGVSVGDQIKIGSRIKTILDTKKERISSEINGALAKVSTALKAHDLMDDRMIFNAALLIDKERNNELEIELYELNKLYAGTVDFRCVGPLPPYSFYTAEVEKLPFNDIEWAKEKLEIDGVETKEEIIKAYRNRARIYHPDNNIDSHDAERQFNEIFRAYKILCEYCDGNGRLPDEKEAGQNAVIIKVRE
ncbi:MAG: GvpL/GvpF family gas vesicle protein [Nitrospirae bacterium]|nr:GvpL/GvpF family gas vesicle protein [Nitrospirota bacterium]